MNTQVFLYEHIYSHNDYHNYILYLCIEKAFK